MFYRVLTVKHYNFLVVKINTKYAICIINTQQLIVYRVVLGKVRDGIQAAAPKRRRSRTRNEQKVNKTFYLFRWSHSEREVFVQSYVTNG